MHHGGEVVPNDLGFHRHHGAKGRKEEGREGGEDEGVKASERGKQGGDKKETQGTYSASTGNPCVKKFWFIDPDIKDLFCGGADWKTWEGGREGGREKG